ncbi:MAG: class I SAM-dependent methyltransferase [Methylococcaceae bacterium]
MKDIQIYLNGKTLFGDDFNTTQIAEWFADEKEGFADLGAKDAAAYNYGYHALNKFHGFKYLPNREFENVLGFGSAYGEELLPIKSQIKSATIVDPSDAFVRDSVYGIPLTYVKPSPDGKLPFANDNFDLMTCFGVLHHIPNVSSVVSELARILKPDGYILLREPIVSMGDWRHPRRGLTKRERGIPLHILEAIVKSNGLEIVKCTLCDFPVTERIFLKLGMYNTYLATLVDAWVSAAFAWNLNYHPSNTLQRFRSRSAFLVLRKSQ